MGIRVADHAAERRLIDDGPGGQRTAHQPLLPRLAQFHPLVEHFVGGFRGVGTHGPPRVVRCPGEAERVGRRGFRHSGTTYSENQSKATSP